MSSPAPSGSRSRSPSPSPPPGNTGPTHFSVAGHLGHLDKAQQKIFDDFRASELDRHEATLQYLAELDKARTLKVHEREATQEELAQFRADREAEWPYELARFLRATKWKLEDAQKKYSEYLDWRRRESIDTVLDEWPFNALLLDRVIGNNAAGFDKKGRPLYIEKSGSVLVDPILSCFTDGDTVRSHVFQQEQSCVRAAAVSKVTGKHVELFTQIMDLNGLTMSGNRATKFTKIMVATDAAFYPERMGDLYIINAPWVFPIIWKLVKGWIDPVTRTKIHVISGDCKAELRKYIDADQLPVEYGGCCNSCPNSPECCKQYTISDFAGLLPLRMGDPSLEGLLKHETIKAGKNLKVSVEIPEGGGVVEWFWNQTGEKDDIDWSITFTPKDPAVAARAAGMAPGAKDAPKEIKVVEVARVENTGFYSPQGSYKATAAGTFTCCWDNHFSWMSSKSIHYLVRPTQERRTCTVPYGEEERLKRPDIIGDAYRAAEKFAAVHGKQLEEAYAAPSPSPSPPPAASASPAAAAASS